MKGTLWSSTEHIAHSVKQQPPTPSQGWRFHLWRGDRVEVQSKWLLWNKGGKVASFTPLILHWWWLRHKATSSCELARKQVAICLAHTFYCYERRGEWTGPKPRSPRKKFSVWILPVISENVAGCISYMFKNRPLLDLATYIKIANVHILWISMSTSRNFSDTYIYPHEKWNMLCWWKENIK